MIRFPKSEVRSTSFSAPVFLLLMSLMSGPAAATEFNKPLNVSRSRTRIDTGAAIAVDPNNKVHIAWNAFYPKAGAPDGVAGDIYYASNVSGKFSAPVRIRVPAGWYSRDPSIAVDGTGHAHIVFRRSMNQAALMSEDDLYYVTNAKGDFKHPILLVDGKYGISGQVSGPSVPRVHCDSRGRVHLTFLAGIGYQGDLVVYMNNRSGAWTKPALAVQGDFLIMHSSCLDRNGFQGLTRISAGRRDGGAVAIDRQSQVGGGRHVIFEAGRNLTLAGNGYGCRGG